MNLFAIWRQPIERTSARVLGWVAVSAGILLLAKWIRDVSRGFEFTDEGYYFLILQNPWKNFGSSFFGFFLHPLYLLAGGDPGLYRLFGLVLLLVLGIGVVRVWMGSANLKRSAFHWAASAVIISGVLLVFSNGQRTPAYNYLVFMGGLVSWLGYFRILVSGMKDIAAWLTLGIGLGMVAIAKWSAFFPLLLIFLLLSRPWADARACRGWGWAITASFCLVVLLLFYAGGDAILSIVRQVKLLTENLGTHGVGLLGYYVPTMINFLYRSLRAFVYGFPLLAILWWIQRRSPAILHEIRLWAWLLPWAVLGAGFLFGLAKGGISSFSRVGSNVFAEQLWVLAAFLVIGKREAWTSLGSCRAPMIGLLLTPFALGLGTASALGDYAGHGAVFFQLTGLFLWKIWIDRGLSTTLAAAFLWVATILNLARANASLEDPYRAAIPGRCDVAWEIPGEGRIYLDSERAEVISTSSMALRAAGFRRGDPLIAIGNLPGLVYLVGGWSPGTPWYYDTHVNSPQFVNRVLESLSPNVRDSSWVLLREDGGLFAHRADLLARLQRTGRAPLEIGPVPLEGKSTRLFLWPPVQSH